MFRSLFFILLLLFAACHDSGSSVSPNGTEGEINLKDFASIESSKDTVYLGTNQESAWIKERPQMSVLLDYDFYIGKHEVTCKEYRALMKGGAADGCEELLPVSRVTFFDAVLYANELSKKQGLDTAYTYSERTFDSQGRCTNLVGYRFLPEVDAFRLPTEAEWIKVANLHYVPEEGWNRDNSDYSAHEPCSADVSKQGVCDMAGNLKEWVNDWFGSFKDTTLTNYLGAPDGGTLGEHVIKGGCFNIAPEKDFIYNRGSVYTVSASSNETYVGFRLAFGKIPGGVWLGNNGYTVTENYSVLSTSADVFKKLGTANVKLVFRDNLSGSLVYTDYFDAKPQVNVIPDTLDCFHPDISPDGIWVAFSTGAEGSSGKSSVYVRKLDMKGTSLTRLDADNASIPRFRVTADGDTVLVYVTSAENNSDSDSFRKQSTWQVPFKKGVFGVPEKLFDGAYHGGVSFDNRLAVTGARLLRARIAGKEESVLSKSARDTVWFDKEQACNASLSKDESKRTLFLDFGSDVGKKFVGEDYDIHERILVADSNGKLIHSVKAPRGYSFDHSEWASERFFAGEVNQKFAVASLSNANGGHEKIALVNLEDSTLLNLMEGDDLYHPCLWVGALRNPKTDKVLDQDSAGIYYSDKFMLTDALWRFKMELFWQHRDSVKVLALGSSRPLNGFRSKLLDSAHFSVNVSQTPNSIYSSRDFLNNYGFNHLKKLKYVVISLDIDFWWEPDDDVYNFFKAEYKSYPGFVFDKNHDYWKSGYPEGLYEKTRNATSSRGYDQVLSEYGFINGSCGTVWDSVPPMDGDTTKSQELDDVKKSLAALEEILEAASKKDVKVIGVIFPQSPFYREMGAYGRHGLRRSNAEKLIALLEDLEKDHSNFILMDENKMGEHDYEARHFGDGDHLCATGAAKLTRRVESVINSLEQE